MIKIHLDCPLIMCDLSENLSYRKFKVGVPNPHNVWVLHHRGTRSIEEFENVKMFLFNQLLGLNLTTHINSIINSGNDDDDIIIYVAIGISVAAFLVVGCCKLVKTLFFFKFILYHIYIISILYLHYIYMIVLCLVF